MKLWFGSFLACINQIGCFRWYKERDRLSFINAVIYLETKIE